MSSGTDFTSYDSFLKNNYVAKALDTLVYSDQFLARVKRFPITSPIRGKEVIIPFDARRTFSHSATFSDAQALSKLPHPADMALRWRVPIVDAYSVVRITEKALRAGSTNEGAVFRTIVNAGNKCLKGLQMKLLSSLFQPQTGQSAVANPLSGAEFTLANNGDVVNLERGDYLEFRNAAGTKKGTGFVQIAYIDVNANPIKIGCSPNPPSLAAGDLVYRRGDYGKPHIAGFPAWYVKNITATNRTLFGVERGPNRNTMFGRRIYANYWVVQATDKLYDVIMDAAGNIGAVNKANPTIAVCNPLSYKNIVTDMLEDYRTNFLSGPNSFMEWLTTPFCPLDKIYLLDEECMGFYFLPPTWKMNGLDQASITPEKQFKWSQGVEKFNEEGVNLVDFNYTKGGSFMHQSYDDAGFELRASFHGNFVIKAPGSGTCIELDSARIPRFKAS